jgi:hypothetical protein
MKLTYMVIDNFPVLDSRLRGNDVDDRYLELQNFNL